MEDKTWRKVAPECQMQAVPEQKSARAPSVTVTSLEMEGKALLAIFPKPPPLSLSLSLSFLSSGVKSASDCSTFIKTETYVPGLNPFEK